MAKCPWDFESFQFSILFELFLSLKMTQDKVGMELNQLKYQFQTTRILMMQ